WKRHRYFAIALGGFVQPALLEEIRGRSGHVAQFVGADRRCQFRIIAVLYSHQLEDHEVVLATLDLNFLDWSRHDFSSGGFDHTVADADSRAEGFVDSFQARGNIHSIAHHCVAQSFARADVADQHLRALQTNANV